MNYSIMIESLPSPNSSTYCSLIYSVTLYTNILNMYAVFVYLSYLVWIEKKQEAYFFWKIKKGIIKKCRRNFTFVFLVVFLCLRGFFLLFLLLLIFHSNSNSFYLCLHPIYSHQHSSSPDLSSTGCFFLCFWTCFNRVFPLL